MQSQTSSPSQASAYNDNTNYKKKVRKRKNNTHNNLYCFICRNILYPIFDQPVKFI